MKSPNHISNCHTPQTYALGHELIKAHVHDHAAFPCAFEAVLAFSRPLPQRCPLMLVASLLFKDLLFLLCHLARGIRLTLLLEALSLPFPLSLSFQGPHLGFFGLRLSCQRAQDSR